MEEVGNRKTKQKREVGNRRKGIPSTTQHQVLMEAGYKCGNPACRHILTLELHHIVWVKDGGGNEPSNLIALCSNCHSLHTYGHIPEKAIRHWKGMLLALNHAFDREAMDLLLFLYHTEQSSQNIWFTGDGILKFAGLIATGLVHIHANSFSSTVSYPFTPRQAAISTHQLKLTETGYSLVEAWITGDQEKYRQLLTQPHQITVSFTEPEGENEKKDLS